jgi:glutathione peroxidase
MSIYDFNAISIDGEEKSLEEYKGKVLIIVNTASKCGFTPQYDDLQKIYDKYRSQGFEVLGFPCNQFAGQEPENNSGVKNFCEINYGVNFPLFEKIDVRGKTAHPLFRYLTENTTFNGFDMEQSSSRMLNSFLQESFPEYLLGDSIKWNFTKFLVDKKGNVVSRFEPTTEPISMTYDIERLLLS